MDGRVSQFLTTVAILQLSWFTPAEHLNTVIFNDLPKAQTSFVLPSKHFLWKRTAVSRHFAMVMARVHQGKIQDVVLGVQSHFFPFFPLSLLFFFLFPSDWCFFHGGTATVSPGPVLGMLTNMSIFAYDYSQRKNALYNSCLCLKSISLLII